MNIKKQQLPQPSQPTDTYSSKKFFDKYFFLEIHNPTQVPNHSNLINKSQWEQTFGSNQNQNNRELSPLQNADGYQKIQFKPQNHYQHSQTHLPKVTVIQPSTSHQTSPSLTNNELMINTKRFNLTFEQQNLLRELHEEQQRQLQEIIRQQQQQQMTLLTSWMMGEKIMENEIIQPISQPSFSQEKKGTGFKPYTLKQYQMLKAQPIISNASLGPMVNPAKWKKQKERVDKMNEFAEQVKIVNQKKIKKMENYEKPKEKTMRDKAIEYSKSIVRPKIRKQNSDDNDLEVIKEQEEDDIIREYEQKNRFYKEQLDKLM